MQIKQFIKNVQKEGKGERRKDKFNEVVTKY